MTDRVNRHVVPVIVMAAVAAQLLDMLTYSMAVSRFPGGEANPLMSGAPEMVVVRKVVAIVLMLVILARVTGRKRTVGAGIAGVVGAFGAATNIVFGVLA